MDKYLKENSAYERLWAEYNKYGSLIVAVDFDDTIFDFHDTGESYEMVRQLVRDLHEIGCYIIIWTGNQDTVFIKSFLAENNIPYHSINEDAPYGVRGNRKLYANIYVDDRSSIRETYYTLTKLVSEVKKNTFYRVCNEETKQGLWYRFDGSFTGLIHDRFNFCANKDLKMDFDEELVGWLSAVPTLEALYQWFTKDDIKELQKHGWFIYEYRAEDSKFYDRFQHLVIKQDTSKVIRKIEL